MDRNSRVLYEVTKEGVHLVFKIISNVINGTVRHIVSHLDADVPDELMNSFDFRQMAREVDIRTR